MDLKKLADSWLDSKLDELESEETKKEIVDAWNKDINIPIIGEKTEAKILSALLDSALAIARKVLKK